MRRSLACGVLLGAVSLGQSPVQIVEPAARASKLLHYATKMDGEAQRAVAAGRRRALADARLLPQKVSSPTRAGTVEDLINQRVESSNGIYVDQPKVYDDSLLQQMLGSAQSRLVSMQALDQSGVAKAVGNVTGANQQITSFGISGGAVPPVVTNSAGTTTTPSFGVPGGAAPPPATSLPNTQAPSASDVLNEQVQLTYEIANLRLLLEGSLSDQMMVGTRETFAKPRATLGFPVILAPQKRYKNAVAVVEVVVETNRENDASAAGEPPSITALLPREKTYNVASLSDKSFGVGGGVATGMAGVSGNFLSGHKQYFIVKDQDTLAAQFELSAAELGELAARGVDTRRVRAFGWQFRPVLGRQFVQAGAKQVFVQLAFPGRGSASVKSFGNVFVRTYWRRVDPKTGILGEVIEGSLESGLPGKIANYDMRQRYGAVAAFNPSWLEDLGTGQMLVKLEGRLLPGTYLRVGSTIIQPGAGGAPSDLKTTRFVANIADLAALKTYVVSRDGTEYPLKIEPGPNNNQFRVDRLHVKVSATEDGTSVLQVPITNFITSQDIPPVLLIGGKVLGYSDAPIERNCNPAAGRCLLTAVVPSGLIEQNPNVTVKALMVDEDGGLQAELKANRSFTLFSTGDAQERLVYLTHDEKTATYLLYGRALNQVNLVWPVCPAKSAGPADPPCLQPVAGERGDGSLRLLQLPLDFAKNSSALVFERSQERGYPFVLALPALPASNPVEAGKGKQETGFPEAILVGANEATLTGDHLDAITGVQFGGKPLVIAARTSTSIQLTGLAEKGVSATAKTQDVTLLTAAGPSKIKLRVVTNKVELIQK